MLTPYTVDARRLGHGLGVHVVNNLDDDRDDVQVVQLEELEEVEHEQDPDTWDARPSNAVANLHR